MASATLGSLGHGGRSRHAPAADGRVPRGTRPKGRAFHRAPPFDLELPEGAGPLAGLRRPVEVAGRVGKAPASAESFSSSASARPRRAIDSSRSARDLSACTPASCGCDLQCASVGFDGCGAYQVARRLGPFPRQPFEHLSVEHVARLSRAAGPFQRATGLLAKGLGSADRSTHSGTRGEQPFSDGAVRPFWYECAGSDGYP